MWRGARRADGAAWTFRQADWLRPSEGAHHGDQDRRDRPRRLPPLDPRPRRRPPAGFTFNQFLVRDDQPFLFHTGMRQLFPLVSDAVGAARRRVEHLRWISFGHVEADECGAMNQFLAAAPAARSCTASWPCMVSLNDLADRPPASIADDEALDTGSHRLRFLPTPHVPHNWESGLWFDETTTTLFAGDLFTARRRRPGDRRPRPRRAGARRRGAVPRDVDRRRDRARRSTPRRPRADHAGLHARLVVPGRRRRPAEGARRTGTTRLWSPPDRHRARREGRAAGLCPARRPVRFVSAPTPNEPKRRQPMPWKNTGVKRRRWICHPASVWTSSSS